MSEDFYKNITPAQMFHRIDNFWPVAIAPLHYKRKCIREEMRQAIENDVESFITLAMLREGLYGTTRTQSERL